MATDDIINELISKNLQSLGLVCYKCENIFSNYCLKIVKKRAMNINTLHTNNLHFEVLKNKRLAIFIANFIAI